MFRQVWFSLPRPGWGLMLALPLTFGVTLGSRAATPGAVPSSGAKGAADYQKTSERAKVADDYGKLSMSFEANQGQTASDAKFLAHGSGYGLFLTAQDAVLVLRKPVYVPGGSKAPRLTPYGVAPNSRWQIDPAERGYNSRAAATSPRPSYTTDVIRMQMPGANAKAEPTGEDRLPGTSNYFKGNDPAKWHTNVPNFKRVSYAGIYPGVNLVYYGNQQQLEYDFVVAPGASVSPIRLRFVGAKGVKLDADGNLAIAAENGSIGFHKPTVYQMVDGSRRTIAGAFRLMADNTVGFTLGRYDHARALVIDPILAYSTYFGGSTGEYVVSVAVDSTGNAYVTGLTISEDFPTTAGAFQSVNYASPANAVSTAFISKFNASGTALLYSTFLGGVAIPNTLHEQGDYGKAIAVDASGNAYVTGYTYSADFPITSGAFQTGNQAATIELATGFVTKLNPSGTGLVYSTYLGGNTLDELTAIALDSSGDAYISGISFSSNFPTTAGVLQTINKSYSSNGFNAVVTKMNPTGSGLIYSTYLGGGSTDGSTLDNVYWTNPIVVDKSGNAYVAGFTSSGNFPVTSGAYQTTNPGSIEITVSKLNPTASALLYSTYLGGNTISYCEGLAVDSAGNAYVAGYTSDLDFPVTKGAFQTVNKADTNTSVSPYSNENGFLTKLNPTGTALVYSTYLGGTTGPWGGDQIYELAIDSSGDAYVAGAAMSADFPVTSNAYQPKNAGATHCCDYTAYTSDAFLTEFNPTGTAEIYSTYLGGSGMQSSVGEGGSGDSAYGLALGPNGSVVIVGFTSSGNFPVTTGSYQHAFHTTQNTGFVAEFDLGASPTSTATDTVLTASANPVVPGTAVTYTAVVTPASGTVVPTGNVVFSVDEAVVSTVALNASGKASYSNSSLVAGAHYVLASYGGSTSYEASGDGFNEIIAPVLPVISPAAGTYESQQTVTITSTTSGAVLYYTLDGSTPTVFSNAYTGPITVNTAKTVNAIAVSEHDASTATVSNAYQVIGSPAVLAGPATAIGTAGATFNGFANTLGLAGSYYFRYGTSSSSLTSVTAKTALAAATTRSQVSSALTTLTAKTTYYFQLVVTTPGGTTAGSVVSFTTN